MKVEKMTVRYERKFNVGDYSAFSVSVMPTVIIEEGDDLNDVFNDVWDMCESEVVNAAIPILHKYGACEKHNIGKAKVREFYLGKEVTNAD